MCVSIMLFYNYYNYGTCTCISACTVVISYKVARYGKSEIVAMLAGYRSFFCLSDVLLCTIYIIFNGAISWAYIGKHEDDVTWHKN